MAMTRGDIQVATSTQGGFMKGLKRTLGGESFFVNDFSSGSGGVVGVAAALPGDMSLVSLAGSGALLVQSGSWIASDPTVDVDSKWGGGKTFFSGEGLILLRCSGQGDMLISAYGAIRSHQLTGRRREHHARHGARRGVRGHRPVLRPQGGQLEVDDPRRRGPGHRLHRTGARVPVQTRSSSDLVSWIQSKLPPSRGCGSSPYHLV